MSDQEDLEVTTRRPTAVDIEATHAAFRKRLLWRRTQVLLAKADTVPHRQRRVTRLDDGIEFQLADYDPSCLISIGCASCLGWGVFAIARSRYVCTSLSIVPRKCVRADTTVWHAETSMMKQSTCTPRTGGYYSRFQALERAPLSSSLWAGDGTLPYLRVTTRPLPRLFLSCRFPSTWQYPSSQNAAACCHRPCGHRM